jgi:hypothetical protein
MKKLYFKALNDADSIVIYSDYQQPKMKIQIWNITQLDKGLNTIEFEEAVAHTITWAGPWSSSNHIMMFGNPDQGNPQSFDIHWDSKTMPKPEVLTNM